MYFHQNSSGLIEFLNDEPPDSKTIGTIKWPYLYNKRTVKLIITRSKSLGDSKEFPVSKNFNYRDLAVLRSQLQKCARRKEQDIGLGTAVAMCGIIQNRSPQQIGLFEMLRRLTIIIIEDCVLLREYGELVWYQCAMSKGLFIGKGDVNRILNITNKVMSGEWCDKSYRFYEPLTNLFKEIISSDISIKDRDLILAVQLRNSFHGMPGDVHMLNRSTNLWLTRLSDDSELLVHLDRYHPQDTSEYKEITRDQILEEAFDHHCTDICTRVQNTLPVDKDLLGTLIWDYRSSINLRLDIEMMMNRDLYNPKPNKKMWTTVENIVRIEVLAIKDEFVNKR